MGRGTIQMSGLYEHLISECQLLRKPRLSSHQTVCFMSFWSERGLSMDSACSVRRGLTNPGSLRLVIALRYFWICCQRLFLFPLMASLASNDVMQWHNDALSSRYLFAHCPHHKTEGMCPKNVGYSHKSLYKVISPSMRTYCTSVNPQSS